MLFSHDGESGGGVREDKHGNVSKASSCHPTSARSQMSPARFSAETEQLWDLEAQPSRGSCTLQYLNCHKKFHSVDRMLIHYCWKRKILRLEVLTLALGLLLLVLSSILLACSLFPNFNTSCLLFSNLETWRPSCEAGAPCVTSFLPQAPPLNCPAWINYLAQAKISFLDTSFCSTKGQFKGTFNKSLILHWISFWKGQKKKVVSAALLGSLGGTLNLGDKVVTFDPCGSHQMIQGLTGLTLESTSGTTGAGNFSNWMCVASVQLNMLLQRDSVFVFSPRWKFYIFQLWPPFYWTDNGSNSCLAIKV